MFVKLHVESPQRAKLYIHQNPSTINASKSLEGFRMWKEDYLVIEPTPHNIQILENSLRIKIDIIGDSQRVLGTLADSDKRWLEYSPKTKPRSYQAKEFKRNIKAYKESPGFAYWWDPGTGKSKAAIDFMCHLKCEGEIDFVIVLAPKGVHQQWANDQIPIHSGLPYSVHWWNTVHKDPWNSFHSPNSNREDAIIWYCINYDAIKTKGGEFHLNKILQPYNGHKTFGLILDESHMVKNYRTARWKKTQALSAFKNCRSKLLLSGTPLSKDLVDEWSQLKIADESILGIRYVTHFRNTYCILGGYTGREFIGPKNLKRYKEKTASFVSRVRKDELDDLPPKVFNRWRFDMEEKQRKTYHQMRKDLIAQIYDGTIATAANAAVGVLRLQQISNGFLKADNIDHPTNLFPIDDNPRIVALQQVIDLIGKNNPIIIWCRFRWDIQNICSVLIDGAMPLHGGVTGLARENTIMGWLDGEKPYLVATPGTGGVGLNLQHGGCKHAIYYSNSEHYIQRIQSEDRIHRIGTKGDQVMYYDLIAKGSRDLKILANLKAKKSLSDLVLDDILEELETVEEEVDLSYLFQDNEAKRQQISDLMERGTGT